MKANWSKKTLVFKQPAVTSRSVMQTRVVWYITLTDYGITGVGECAPLPGLSMDDVDLIESKLDEVCTDPNSYLSDLSRLSGFPSIRFGMEMAQLDLTNGGGQNYYNSPFSDSEAPISINGLIWMGDRDFVIQQVSQKLTEGWRCIKMKIGALDFDDEINILKSVRSQFGKNVIEIRVDANGAFSKNGAVEKLDRLAEFDLHSIEQPIQSGQWDLLSELCKTSPVPIALDEELIPLIDENERIQILEQVNPQYLVLKPSLLGGFSESENWMKLAKERNIGWWITSALESSIGLNAIAQWTSKMNPEGFQGLGTGQLFTNNLPSPLNVKSGVLSSNKLKIWKDVNLFISEWLSGNDEMMLQTSGSTGKPKQIAVKKDWMKNSARLTGKTFGLNEGDSVLLCIPMKYVAAKMMVVRALELELDLKVVEPSSTPMEKIEGEIDFAAMVPLQLEKSLSKIDKVKTLIVGGSPIHPKLIYRLQSIPTQIIETYSMAETLTHVAIKPLNGSNRSDVFHALDGVCFTVDDRGCLVVHAPAVNPESIITNDRVELVDDTSFRWLGRMDNVINSGGIKIIPEAVEAKLAEVIPDRRFFIAGMSDESLGEKVILVVEGTAMEISFASLDKYERPLDVYFLLNFKLTDTGKIDRIETLKMYK